MASPPDLLSTTTSSSSSSSSSDENTSSSSSSLLIKPLATLLSPNSGPISSLSLASTDLLISSSDHHLLLFHNLLPLPATTPAISSSIKTIATAGNLLLTAHQDSRIRLWKLTNSGTAAFKLAATLPTKSDVLSNLLFKSNNAYVQTRRHHRKLWIEHADAISALAVADNNETLYSASWDKSIKVWSLRDLKCIESIKAHDDAINALVACKGVLYSASADGKVKMWARRNSTSKKHSLKGCLNDLDLKNNNNVSWNALVVSDHHQNGRGLVVYGGGSDGRVVGWEVEVEEEGNNNNNNIMSRSRVVCEVKERAAVLCLCAVGEYMCVGAGDGSVGVWKVMNSGGGGGRRLWLWKAGHQGPVKCLEAAREAEEGFVLYSGGMDGSVKVWWVCVCATAT